jgi:hypothetical protein
MAVSLRRVNVRNQRQHTLLSHHPRDCYSGADRDRDRPTLVDGGLSDPVLAAPIVKEIVPPGVLEIGHPTETHVVPPTYAGVEHP